MTGTLTEFYAALREPGRVYAVVDLAVTDYPEMPMLVQVTKEDLIAKLKASFPSKTTVEWNVYERDGKPIFEFVGVHDESA